ncbi:hypothetical protein MWN34_12580 [Ancylobacter sp. 6x-1]|uniref:PspA/IM30 family protein n=1 Tax=Ancylobacter crimeensis TaxID=2579147 RepID=A0ABT0DCR0_9HYPH|nr:hypothetical protein [Ancylobacter crimeensis]MCK0197748.1 hypothetical protein [Ancylobacter crimeensis]
MFSKLFSRAAPAPLDELRAALAALDEPALHAAVAAAEAGYRAALLDDDEADVVRADEARRAAQRDMDRAHVRRDELVARIANAEAEERRAAAKEKVAAAIARRDEVVKRWHTDVAKAHKLLAPLAADVATVEAEIEKLNSALYSGSDVDLQEELGAGLKGVRATVLGTFWPRTDYSPDALFAIPPSKTTAPLGWLSNETTKSDPKVGG